MLNNCTLMGKLASQPEERNAGTRSVVNFRLVTWETVKGNKYDSYHNISVWSDYTKNIVRSMQEGDMVICQGKYQTRKVEKNGDSRYYSSLNAFTVQPVSIEGANISDGSGGGGGQNGNASQSSPPSGRGHGPVGGGSADKQQDNSSDEW